MGFTAERFENEPISLFIYDHEFNRDTVEAQIRKNTEFMEEAGQKMYTIIDMQEVGSLTFSESIKVVQWIKDKVLAGELIDPSAMTCFISGPQSIRLFRDILVAQGANQIPIVETLDEALEMVRVQINSH